MLGLVLMVLAGARPLIQDAGSSVSGPCAQHAASGTLLTHLARALLAPVWLSICLPGLINVPLEHPGDCSCLRQSRRLYSVSVNKMK